MSTTKGDMVAFSGYIQLRMERQFRAICKKRFPFLTKKHWKSHLLRDMGSLYIETYLPGAEPKRELAIEGVEEAPAEST